MQKLTCYFALPFTRLEEGRLAPGKGVECSSLAAALQRPETMSRAPTNAGAIAFFRVGDANLGEVTEDVVIRAYGDVPNGLSDS
jgi:hypothetical protein